MSYNRLKAPVEESASIISIYRTFHDLLMQNCIRCVFRGYRSSFRLMVGSDRGGLQPRLRSFKHPRSWFMQELDSSLTHTM